MNSFNRKCAIWFLHYGLIILCDHETDCNNADTILTPGQLIRAHYCSLYSGSNIQWLEYTETNKKVSVECSDQILVHWQAMMCGLITH